MVKFLKQIESKQLNETKSKDDLKLDTLFFGFNDDIISENDPNPTRYEKFTSLEMFEDYRNLDLIVSFLLEICEIMRASICNQRNFLMNLKVKQLKKWLGIMFKLMILGFLLVLFV